MIFGMLIRALAKDLRERLVSVPVGLTEGVDDLTDWLVVSISRVLLPLPAVN